MLLTWLQGSALELWTLELALLFPPLLLAFCGLSAFFFFFFLWNVQIVRKGVFSFFGYFSSLYFLFINHLHAGFQQLFLSDPEPSGWAYLKLPAVTV